MNKDKDIEIRQEEAASNPSRRKLLKALTAGGAAAAVVPSEWTKPALKSVLLPAHAQATGPTPGGGDDCASFVGWAFTDGGTSFSMSVVGRLDQSCGQGVGTVTVYNSSGDVIVQCQGVDAGADAGFLPSFSCSEQTNNNAASPDEGELVTFVAEFDNGCSCTVVRVAQ